jgi:hypothetical protein
MKPGAITCTLYIQVNDYTPSAVGSFELPITAHSTRSGVALTVPIETVTRAMQAFAAVIEEDAL